LRLLQRRHLVLQAIVSFPVKETPPKEKFRRCDVLPENDGRLKREDDGGFGGPLRKERTMKRSKFSEEQVVYALRQAEVGTPVGDLCRQLGVAEATFYAWKKKYAHLGMSELRRLRQLEEENSRWKRLVADLSLDKHMLSEVLRKKV
jgi:putative transposase